MIQSLIFYFYPQLTKKDIRKFSLLALTFLFIIGSYWLLRLLKDVIIFNLAFPVELGWQYTDGPMAQTIAKQISPWIVLSTVFIYSKLIDWFKKHQLFYIIISFYMIAFSCITSIFFMQAQYGSAYLGATLLKYAGYANYLLTESFGSLVVALFWSFTVSITTTDEAKRGFSLIIAAAQFGAMGGSSLMLIKNIAIWPLQLFSIFLLASIMISIKYLVRTLPEQTIEQPKTNVKEITKKPSLFSGITTLAKHPYLMGVLVVSTFYEIAGTIVDFQMKAQARFADNINFQEFMGIFGVAVNAIAFAIALGGTNYFVKKFGLKVCLLLYPVIFGVSLLSLYGYYSTYAPSASSMIWATFIVMMIVKASAYAINNPVKEIMYIPTSKDAKFKTKGFIDMFGNRMSKLSGARLAHWMIVPNMAAQTIENLMTTGTFISLGVILFWLVIAIYVGIKNQQLTETNTIIS